MVCNCTLVDQERTICLLILYPIFYTSPRLSLHLGIILKKSNDRLLDIQINLSNFLSEHPGKTHHHADRHAAEVRILFLRRRASSQLVVSRAAGLPFSFWHVACYGWIDVDDADHQLSNAINGLGVF